MENRFFVSVGSVPGSHHRLLAKNNQDALAVNKNELTIVAVVCDGCGSGAHSEVGSQLAAPFIVRNLLGKLRNADSGAINFEEILEKMRVELLEFLRLTAAPLSENLAVAVLEYLLFTAIGAVITEQQTVIFSFGDGVFALNGEITVIDENNEPAYLAYGLLSEEKARLKFVIRKIIDTDAVQCLLIGTDGLVELEKRRNEKIIVCGKEQIIGGIGQFFIEEKYRQNAGALQKRLNVFGLNRKMLFDDATAILVRRCSDRSRPVTTKFSGDFSS